MPAPLVLVADDAAVVERYLTALRAAARRTGSSTTRAARTCTWAREWVDRMEARRSPLALLQARRLVVACLSAAGRIDEAKAMLASIAAQCAPLGMIRYLADGGPYVVSLLAALRDDQLADRWRPEWPPLPAPFLTDLVAADAAQVV